ncbi:MAG: hypothetical protein HFG64_16635 [Lachnospiraceae bacterium]|nr:hypothetical protein [Lachnospiraceae bacterium]
MVTVRGIGTVVSREKDRPPEGGLSFFGMENAVYKGELCFCCSGRHHPNVRDAG